MIKFKNDMVKESRENMRGGVGEINLTHLFKKEELHGKCRLFSKVTIPPGNSIGFHEHKDEEEVYYLLQGHGRVLDDGVEREIGPGDAVLTGGGKGHSIKNIGNKDLEMIAVILLYC